MWNGEDIDWVKAVEGWAALAIGGLALYGAVRDTVRMLAARSWPSAEGHVTESRLTRSDDGESVFEDVSIRYIYKVGERVFEGTRVHAGGDTSVTLFGGGEGGVFSNAALTKSRYPNGRPVRVFYNPARPEECCLEQGGLFNIVIESLFAAGCLWLASVLL